MRLVFGSDAHFAPRVYTLMVGLRVFTAKPPVTCDNSLIRDTPNEKFIFGPCGKNDTHHVSH